MSILNDYRRIWIQANGPIPRDSENRSYEIHHINGIHSDNRLENLQLVSIEEHYEIHKAQGDWYACIKIAQRFSAPDLREMYDRMAKEMKGNTRGMGNKGKRRPDLSERNKLGLAVMSADGRQRVAAAARARVLTEETREKLRNARIGYTHSEATKEKLRQPKKSTANFSWWTDGVTSVRAAVCPEGFRKGRLLTWT